MTVSAMKLSRVTLDSLKNLEQDPQAVNKALDAYQGSIRGDRSVGDNLKRQAQSIEKLRVAITQDVPQAIGALSASGDAEAQEAWLNGSEAQKTKWREAIQKGEVGPWHSPFFNMGMERMVAADHVGKYQASYAADYEKARLTNDSKYQTDGKFDIHKFGESYLDEYTTTNGLANIRAKNYTVFAKGVGQIHAAYNAKASEAKGAVVVENYMNAFGGLVGRIVTDATLTGDQQVQALELLYKKNATDVGLSVAEGKRMRTIILDAGAAAYKKSVVLGIGDPEGYLETMGNMQMGNQLFKETPQFASWVETVRAEGDQAVDRAVTREDLAQKNTDLKLVKAWREDRDKFIADGGDWKAFYTSTPERMKILDWARANQDSTLSHRQNAAKAIIAQSQGRIISGAEIQQLMLTMGHDRPWKDTQRELIDGGATDQQLATAKRMYDNWVELNTGATGEVHEALQKRFLRPTTIADPIKMPVPDRVALDVAATRQRGVALHDLAKIEDLSDEQKRAEVQNINSNYEKAMKQGIADWVKRDDKKTLDIRREAGIETIVSTWLENDGKDVSMWLNGDQYLRSVVRDTKALGNPDLSKVDKQILVDRINRHLLSSGRYRKLSELYDIPLTKENLGTLYKLEQTTIDRVREKRNLAPEKQQEVVDEQNEQVSSLERFREKAADIALTAVGISPAIGSDKPGKTGAEGFSMPNNEPKGDEPSTESNIDDVMGPFQKVLGVTVDGNGGVNTEAAAIEQFGQKKWAEIVQAQKTQFASQTKRLSEHVAPSIGRYIKPEWIQNMWMHETKHGSSVLGGTYNLGNIKGSYNGKSGKFEVHEYLSEAEIAHHKKAGTFVKLGEGSRDGKQKVYVKDTFRKYPSFKEAAEDFTKLLNKPRYAKVKVAKTQHEFVQALKNAGYMTDSVEAYLKGLEAGDSKEPTKTYAVKKGETLWKIAHAHGWKGKEQVDAFMKLNSLNSTTIHPGQKLIVKKAG